MIACFHFLCYYGIHRPTNLNLKEGLRVMELRPCKDDILSLLGVYIVVALCEILLLFVCEFDLFFIIIILFFRHVFIPSRFYFTK